jgi:hypothetical protein
MHYRLDRRGGGRPQVRVKNVVSPGIQRLDELQKVLGTEKTLPLGTHEAVVAMALTICRQAIDTEAVAQIEMLGRRAGLPEATVVADLRIARKTRDQLKLLNDYALRARLQPIALHSFEPTVDALERCLARPLRRGRPAQLGPADPQARQSCARNRTLRWQPIRKSR